MTLTRHELTDEISMSDELTRRVADAEISRVRGIVDQIADKLQTVIVGQVEFRGSVEVVQESIGTIKKAVEPIPSMTTSLALLDRRVNLLEKVVMGAVAIILAAVVTAWVSGVVVTVPRVTAPVVTHPAP